jgi:hypothetical protein
VHDLADQAFIPDRVAGGHDRDAAEPHQPPVSLQVQVGDRRLEPTDAQVAERRHHPFRRRTIEAPFGIVDERHTVPGHLARGADRIEVALRVAHAWILKAV